MNYDMKIAGNGKIPAGEYNDINISGSATILGAVRCKSFSASGTTKGSALECSGPFKTSGSTTFDGNVRAGSIKSSGSFSVHGDVAAASSFTSSGNITVHGDMEAEKIKIDGSLACAGLINAEVVDIKFGTGKDIGSIGGNKITVRVGNDRKFADRIPGVANIVNSVSGNMCVKSYIEGNDILLEHVDAPRVTGRVVTIGKGCRIDLVQYSQEAIVSPKATVGRVEKV